MCRGLEHARGRQAVLKLVQQEGELGLALFERTTAGVVVHAASSHGHGR